MQFNNESRNGLNNEIFYKTNDILKRNPYRVLDVLMHYVNGKSYVLFCSLGDNAGGKYVLELERFSLDFRQEN